MKSLCIIFHRLGPYHWARLNAAGKIGPTVGLEVSGETAEYAWNRVEGAGAFTRVTLFPEQDSRQAPPTEVARRIHQTLDEQDPAAVAIPGWWDKSALAALSWCLKRDRPAIVMSESQRSDAARQWGKEMIKRRIVAMCSTGLAGGAAHVSYLAALGMSSDRIFTGYDVVDNDYFAEQAAAIRREPDAVRSRLQLPRQYFLASNRFLAKKNLPRLLEAFAGYRRNAGAGAWKLVLLGDGPLRPEVLRLREQLGLTDDVLLPGFKQYDELPAYYALAGAFIHASTTEQWGLVVNEAMASGLPVLVSDRCGCASDLVVQGRNGFTFDPFDVPAVSQLLLRLAGGECDLSVMGQVSREIIAGWSPREFATGLRSAAETAWDLPPRRSGLLDQTLLRSLISF